MSKNNTSGAAPGATSNSGAPKPKNYPTGARAQRKLRAHLIKSTGSHKQTILDFQTDNSLRRYLSKAFGTTAQTEPASDRERRTTRNEVTNQKVNEEKGVIEEPFHPESVLTFCGYLGVSRYEMHKTISDSLRNALENEIDKVDLSKNKTELLDMLQSSFQFKDVPELRLVFVKLIKKLGDAIPPAMLTDLASKEDNGELKYGDLLNSFGPDMKRLVWEADWDSVVRGDGVLCGDDADARVGTLEGDNILIDVIRPEMQNYLNNEALINAAELAYTTNSREKKVDTQKRRAVDIDKSNTGDTGTLSVLTKTDKGDGPGAGPSTQIKAEEIKNVTGSALQALKQIMGPRPKLLAAVMNILIAEHGRSAKGDPDAVVKLVNGASFLRCTLLSDVLLSYGQLPRPYQHVRVLAKTLDGCVKNGIVSDKAITEIQQCLKSIFQSMIGKEQASGKQKKESSNKMKPTPKSPDPRKKLFKNDASEHQFQLRLLRKLIERAVAKMKEYDPQKVFLYPVTDEIAPGYSRIIKNPMCICAIEKKAIDLKYSSLSEYENDVTLMFRNCKTFNTGKDGIWFRNEADRQRKRWKTEILSKAKIYFDDEMKNRKTQLNNAANAAGINDNNTTANAKNAASEQKAKMEKDRIDRMLEEQKKLAGKGVKHPSRKRNHDVSSGKIGAISSGSNPQIIEPLAGSTSKKRKQDTTLPSMPALSSMLLSDPFVMRLLLDKVLRALKKIVLEEKSGMPVSHETIPSTLQLIRIANSSPQLCATKGEDFYIPDGGLVANSREDGEDNVSKSFSVLREHLPLLTKLLLQVQIDECILSDHGSLNVLEPLPESTPEEWKMTQSSPPRVLLDLVEGAFVHLVQSGHTNEQCLLSQCQRFIVAINYLSQGNMTDEKCFFVSLTRALLRRKRNMPHSLRDMVVNAWLGWFKSKDGSNSMTGSVHLCFVNLLNEWSSLGNLVLPIDTMLSWSEDAVKAAESNSHDKSVTFVDCWNTNDEKFAIIKSQYECMLKGIPEDRSKRWKEAVGIMEIESD